MTKSEILNELKKIGFSYQGEYYRWDADQLEMQDDEGEGGWTLILQRQDP